MYMNTKSEFYNEILNTLRYLLKEFNCNFDTVQ